METLLTPENANGLSEDSIAKFASYPNGFSGRGVVVCGGGIKNFTNAWVCINVLRKLGCSLPIQLWYLGKEEFDEGMESLLLPLDVECVDGAAMTREHYANRFEGWRLKSRAILNSPFEEVLLLDADNVAVIDPSFLFETQEFKETGAIFWPDLAGLERSREIWRICGVEFLAEAAFETGQIVVDKRRCWSPLLLANWYNEHSDFYYRYSHGDTATFQMAFRKLGKTYAMPAWPVQRLIGTMCQHDFLGRRLFQHRNGDKWSLFRVSRHVFGFLLEDECRAYVETLKQLWTPKLKVDVFRAATKSNREKSAADPLLNATFEYRVEGIGHKPLAFLSDGLIGLSSGGFEVFWDLQETGELLQLKISSEDQLSAILTELSPGCWKGQWLVQPRQVELHQM